MSSNPRYVADYYESLGVEHEATTEEIKKAFRKLARECHPDVAKDDPDAAARFARLRQAYRTLVDPVKRSRYDRSMKRAAEGGGPWRPPGGPFGGVGRGERQGPGKPPSNLDLEDIFGDFGGMSDFGFGAPHAARSSPRPGPEARDGAPGRDINIQVDVPARIAETGGTVTLHYPRLRRSDDGASLFRYNEIYDLRVPPGTSHGDSVRVERMGDAGGAGGPYGDLVCDVRVVGGRAGRDKVKVDLGHGPAGETRGPPPDPWADAEREPPPPPRAAPRTPPPPRPSPPPRSESPRGAPAAEPPRASEPEDRGALPPGAELKVVPIAVTEALLGGRVEVDTAGGRVRVTVPPCTSSGTRLRLRGKGQAGRDLYVELRIVVPRSLDEESRRLIERFAELNPDIARD